MPDVLTIGAIGFLNARPLVYGLEREAALRLRLEMPGSLAALLKAGEVDAALLPSVEYFRLTAESSERARSAPARFVALPVGAIGSRGAVGSVRLFGYAERARLRRVLLDPASRTSNALARIIVVRRFGVSPHFLLPEAAGPSPARAPDAELLIGDRGLVAERPAAEWIADLGLEWHRFTHLPFVYAFWVARADGPLDRLAALLSAALERGLEAREALAAQAPETNGVQADVALRYLTEQVRYNFGPKEQEGLRVFYRMAAEEGLAPDGGRLRFPHEARQAP